MANVVVGIAVAFYQAVVAGNIASDGMPSYAAFEIHFAKFRKSCKKRTPPCVLQIENSLLQSIIRKLLVPPTNKRLEIFFKNGEF